MKRHLPALLAVITLLAAGPPARAAGEVLTIATEAGEVARYDLAGVTLIRLQFFHSYDRQWVTESFRPSPQGLVPTAVTYASDTYDYRYARYRGRMQIKRHSQTLDDIQAGPHDILPAITTRVAYTRPQRLILASRAGSRTLLFSEWAPAGRQITLRIQPEDRHATN